jgi:hypothetical protein
MLHVIKEIMHYHHHHHHRVHEGLGMLSCSLLLKMKLVPPSLPRSSYVPSSVRSILQNTRNYTLISIKCCINVEVNVKEPVLSTIFCVCNLTLLVTRQKISR